MCWHKCKRKNGVRARCKIPSVAGTPYCTRHLKDKLREQALRYKRGPLSTKSIRGYRRARRPLVGGRNKYYTTVLTRKTN